MRGDQFEVGLSKLHEEQQSEQQSKDKKVVAPAWQKARIVREPELKLSVRNPKGSAESYKEIKILFISGLGLQGVLEKGFVQLATTGKLTTVMQNIKDVKNGFCAFLQQKIEGVNVTRELWVAEQFAADDIKKFARFLRVSELSNSSRDSRAHAFKNVIKAYLQVADASDPDFPAIEALSKTPAFKSLPKDAKSTTGDIKSEGADAEKFLSYDQMVAIHDAAAAEVRKVTAEWWRMQEEIRKGNAQLEIGPSWETADLNTSLPLLLAVVAREFPTLLPVRNEIMESHPEIEAALRARNNSESSGKTLAKRSLYPESSQLLPFFILLLFMTRYNMGVLNNLRWSDIADRDDVFAFAPFKPRANSFQPRSIEAGDMNDPLSLRSMLTVIKSMTERLRRAAPEIESDRVFLHVSDNSSKVSAGLEKIFNKQGQGAFRNFLDRHSLDEFNISSIRSTLLDAVTNGGGGLNQAASEGNHSETITTLRHYTSIRTAEGRRITLAESTLQMERWAQTKGEMDPRHLVSKADIKSATPGFGCLNPFESPLPGESPGRLCQSEGHCARCPNAILRSDDPSLIAYVVAYAEASANATHLSPMVFDELLNGYRQLFEEVPGEILEKALDLPKPEVQVR